jgi:tetraacyldisaccharide 4'-kinase
MFKSESVPVATIVIGNLAVGGSGKSPMTAYLARLLRSDFNVAVLSRGYGRMSKGYREIEKDDSVMLAGDEPLQYASELEGVKVAVCEKRVEGIRQLLKHNPAPRVVLLDDAFQHRSLKPGFSILLTDHSCIFPDDYLLPYGRLREPANGARRADLIVVTKCPPAISSDERSRIVKRIRKYSGAPVLFSYIHYRDKLMGLNGGEMPLDSLLSASVYLFCGIARPGPLSEMLRKHSSVMKEQIFPDHHRFSSGDLTFIRKDFARFTEENEQKAVLITTRKDAMRLQVPELKHLLKGLPLFILDIDTAFIAKDDEILMQMLLGYVLDNPAGRIS